MKKVILSLSLATAMFCAHAQEEGEEKVYTPQGGDIGLSIDAAPFLRYTADLLNFSGNQNAVSPQFRSPDQGATVVGRYFLDDNTAIRGIFGVTMSNSVDRSNTAELDAEGDVVTNDNDETQYVLDKVVERQTNVVFGAGLEKRRGYDRLQGFYGAQLTMGIMSGTTTINTYGNDMQSFANSAGGDDERVLRERDATTQYMVNLEAFIGVEYFFAPKMSVGGQFLWGPSLGWGGSGGTFETVEYYDFDDELTRERETELLSSAGSNNFRSLALNASGQLFLSFYF